MFVIVGEIVVTVGRALVGIVVGFSVINGDDVGMFDCVENGTEVNRKVGLEVAGGDFDVGGIDGDRVGKVVGLDDGFITVGSMDNEGEGFREGMDDEVLVG